MTLGLKRYHHTGTLHFVTFSCYRRMRLLATSPAKDTFLEILESTRKRYQFTVSGYVVMPEHVHLLIGEPKRATLDKALQVLKQKTAVRLLKERPVISGEDRHFWTSRYYDFNVWNEPKRVEKLRYLHRNPVVRGLVEKPEEWAWSSFRHHAFGTFGTVEIESDWTARARGETPSIELTK